MVKVWFRLIHRTLSSVHDDIHVLRKAHIRSIPYSRGLNHCCLCNSVNVGLINDGSISSFRGRSPSTDSFYASLSLSVNRWCYVLGLCASMRCFKILNAELFVMTAFFPPGYLTLSSPPPPPTPPPPRSPLLTPAIPWSKKAEVPSFQKKSIWSLCRRSIEGSILIRSGLSYGPIHKYFQKN